MAKLVFCKECKCRASGFSLLGDTSCSDSVEMSVVRVARQSAPLRAFFATHSSSSSEDDSKVDYNSMLGEEERRQRFSEDVVDKDLQDSVRVQKMYRQLQRQVYCGLKNKASSRSCYQQLSLISFLSQNI